MGTHYRVAREHPILGFFVLSIVISWPIWGVQSVWPRSPVGLFGLLPFAGPVVAAAIVVCLSGIDLQSWLAHLRGQGVESYWYGVGFVLPLACVVAITIAAALFFNGPWTVPFFDPRTATRYAIALVTNTILALGVEPGFRGFVLPRLQHRYNALVASGLVAIGWMVWSPPLFAFPGSYLAGFSPLVYLLLLLVVSVFLTYVYNSTGGSIPTTALLNGGFTTSLTFGAVGVSGLEIQVTTLAVWAIPALVVANLYGGERLAEQIPSPGFFAEP